MLKGMKLAMPPRSAIRKGHDIRIVKTVGGTPLNQARSDGDSVLARKLAQSPGARTGENGFGQVRQFQSGKIPDEPIAGDAAFRKDDQFRATPRRLNDELFHRAEVRFLVAGFAFELNGGYPKLPAIAGVGLRFG